ncbi:S8 family serine peptidase [Pararhodobacter zhoushanensis]|uniref:Anti-sigma factor n=1 Tax=Pararhodobacter zhoushanensis TaxID=2479545 RepID=A0ABT3H4J9_9RHOB|nr:hypothetical protein [Pararhodobacter zhoushanensis]MCW1934745.1 hypothetical protein [Pararhodobacter zhoushanensis]
MTRSPDEIALDLPFLINGTLSAADKAEIEALMAEDALLAAEHDALAAIRSEMQAEETRSPGAFGLARLMRDVGREGAATVPARAPSRSWMWQAVAAVAVVGLLAQTFYQRDTGESEARYALASAAMPGTLVVSFAPDATEETIRTLLVGQDLEIVAGPSALGLYRLDVVEGGDLAAAAAALRGAPQIVESVENVEP